MEFPLVVVKLNMQVEISIKVIGEIMPHMEKARCIILLAE